MIQYDCCPYKGDIWTWGHARLGEHHVKTEAEIRVTLLQAKEHQG